MWAADLAFDPALRVTGRRALFELAGYSGSGYYTMANFDLAPDGESFLMLRRVGEFVEPTKINVMVNLASELNRLAPTGRKP